MLTWREISILLILATTVISITKCCTNVAPEVSTLQDAVGYLRGFGYMPADGKNASLMHSLEQLQKYFGLKASGIFDAETKKLMNLPRCGNLDHEARIISKQIQSLSFKFEQLPQGCPTDKGLKWTARALNNTFLKAVEFWKKKFHFLEMTHGKLPHAEIAIKFLTGRYGAGSFDGRGGVMAYALSPYPAVGKGLGWQGEIDFDDAEAWTDGGEGANLLHMAIHALGHSLGLGHSNDSSSVMYPLFKLDVPQINHPANVAHSRKRRAVETEEVEDEYKDEKNYDEVEEEEQKEPKESNEVNEVNEEGKVEKKEGTGTKHEGEVQQKEGKVKEKVEKIWEESNEENEEDKKEKKEGKVKEKEDKIWEESNEENEEDKKEKKEGKVKEKVEKIWEESNEENEEDKKEKKEGKVKEKEDKIWEESNEENEEDKKEKKEGKVKEKEDKIWEESNEENEEDKKEKKEGKVKKKGCKGKKTNNELKEDKVQKGSKCKKEEEETTDIESKDKKKKDKVDEKEYKAKKDKKKVKNTKENDKKKNKEIKKLNATDSEKEDAELKEGEDGENESKDKKKDVELNEDNGKEAEDNGKEAEVKKKTKKSNKKKERNKENKGKNKERRSKKGKNKKMEKSIVAEAKNETQGLSALKSQPSFIKTSQTCVMYVWYRGQQFKGGDRTTFEQCKLQCMQKEVCYGFAYNHDKRRCLFRNIVAENENEVDSFMKTGTGYGPLKKMANVLIKGGVRHVNYKTDKETGGVTSSTEISVDDCNVRCQEEQSCIGTTIRKNFKKDDLWHCLYHMYDYDNMVSDFAASPDNSGDYYVKRYVCNSF